MKKFIIWALLMFLVGNAVNAAGKKPNHFRFFNKKIGISLNFTKGWQIYTDEKNAPDFFKNMLKNSKNKNDSTFFLGMKKNQTAFTKLLVEKYDAGLADYAQLFKTMLKDSDITVLSETYSTDRNNAAICYQSKVNKIPIRFVDYIVIHGGYAFRLSFWSLESLFSNQITEFTAIAQKGLFYVRNAHDWQTLWANVPSPAQPEPPVAQNNNKYMFFTVKGKTNTVYLMGSIHIGQDSFYPFSGNIEKAFANTDNIVVEFNPDSEENSGQIRNMAAYAYLSNNQTLKDVLTPELYAALKTNLSRYGIPMGRMERCKPWVAASSLMALKMMSLGYVGESGTEKYFLRKAGAKKIHELESFAEQVELFDSIDGNAFLGLTLLSLSSMENELEELIDGWKSQDMKKLEELTMKGSDDPSQKDYFDKFYFIRNLAMTEKIENYLDQNEDYFVIVGSGHLVGEKGILSLLKKAGYSVK